MDTSFALPLKAGHRLCERVADAADPKLVLHAKAGVEDLQFLTWSSRLTIVWTTAKRRAVIGQGYAALKVALQIDRPGFRHV